jgi:hypothetical protein
VQNTVDVIEDVPLGDLLVVVMLAKMLQRPVGDVVALVCPLFVVMVEGEALMAGQDVGGNTSSSAGRGQARRVCLRQWTLSAGVKSRGPGIPVRAALASGRDPFARTGARASWRSWLMMFCHDFFPRRFLS